MLVSKLENKSIDSRKLEKYGFVKSGNAFVYSVVICGGQMEVLVTIQDGKMYADVFDNETGEKYVLFYVESAGGAFVGRVRDEYEKVISRIFEQCFDSTVYRTGQTNAVLKYIEGKYGITPEFPWNDENGIVRHGTGGKWFGAFLKVSAKKLGIDSSEILEVLNVKMKPEDVKDKVDGKHIFAAYHMNKKHWITIPFGDYVKTEEICRIIDDSFVLTKNQKKIKGM